MAADALARVGLDGKQQRLPSQISGGEKERAAVARAIVNEPPVLLADEPTGNLDPDNKQAVLQHLIALCKEHQRILLTVTHDHSLLPGFDRVVDMGQLLGSKASAE